MPPKRRLSSRYSVEAATIEVRRAMAQSDPPIQDKELAAELGLEKGNFSSKIHMKRSAFTVEEFGRIADFFRAPEGSGWPFVPGPIRRVQ